MAPNRIPNELICAIIAQAASSFSLFEALNLRLVNRTFDYEMLQRLISTHRDKFYSQTWKSRPKVEIGKKFLHLLLREEIRSPQEQCEHLDSCAEAVTQHKSACRSWLNIFRGAASILDNLIEISSAKWGKATGQINLIRTPGECEPSQDIAHHETIITAVSGAVVVYWSAETLFDHLLPKPISCEGTWHFSNAHYCAIMAAVFVDDIETVCLLADRQPGLVLIQALELACQLGRHSITRELLNRNVDPNQTSCHFWSGSYRPIPSGSWGTPLETAVWFGKFKIVDLLLDRKSCGVPQSTRSIQYKRAISQMSQSQHNRNEDDARILRRMLWYGTFEKDPIFMQEVSAEACENGRDRLVRVLLAHGLDPNHAQQSAFSHLNLAASHGHVTTVKLLLSVGAQHWRVDECRPDEKAKMLDGSALCTALKCGQSAVVDLLYDVSTHEKHLHDLFAIMGATRINLNRDCTYRGPYLQGMLLIMDKGYSVDNEAVRKALDYAIAANWKEGQEALESRGVRPLRDASRPVNNPTTLEPGTVGIKSARPVVDVQAVRDFSLSALAEFLDRMSCC